MGYTRQPLSRKNPLRRSADRSQVSNIISSRADKSYGRRLAMPRCRPELLRILSRRDSSSAGTMMVILMLMDVSSQCFACCWSRALPGDVEEMYLLFPRSHVEATCRQTCTLAIVTRSTTRSTPAQRCVVGLRRLVNGTGRFKLRASHVGELLRPACQELLTSTTMCLPRFVDVTAYLLDILSPVKGALFCIQTASNVEASPKMMHLCKQGSSAGERYLVTSSSLARTESAGV